MTDDLPSGWEWTTLGEIGRYHNGRAFKSSDWSEVGRPIVRIQNLTGSGTKFNHFRGQADQRHVVNHGDLLVSWAATLGVYVWRGPEAVLNQHIFKVESHISPRFHRWLLESVVTDLYRQAHGSGMVHITKKKFDQTPVKLPPAAEQERIVAAIEAHFSRLDAAETAIVSAEKKADALLRSVVGDVCRGSWDTVPLVQIVTSLRNGVFVSRPAPDPPGRPIYRISAVRPLRLRIDDVRYAHPEPDGADDYAVASGDLLFTRYSGNPSYVGAAAVVPEAGRGVLHPDKLIRVVADEAKALPEWIAAYVSVGEGRRQVEQRLKTTAGQVGISGRQLKSVPIAVPSLDYQRSAVARIGTVLADQDRIEKQLAKLRAKSSALRQSILASAFDGSLVSRVMPSRL